MKKVYAPYCRNHDDAIALLEKVSKSTNTLVIFPPTSCVNAMKLLFEMIQLTRDVHIQDLLFNGRILHLLAFASGLVMMAGDHHYKDMSYKST